MKNHEFRDAAYFAYTKAVRDGLLVRADRCSRCRRVGPVDGHHTDYAKPFNVEWLCRQCHSEVHRGTDDSPRVRRIRPQTGTVNMVNATPCAHCHGSGWLAKAMPLTAVQRKVYEFIWNHTQVKGYAPSHAEIAETFGYTTLATVHEHLSNLEKKFWIARKYNDARAINCLVDLKSAEAA